MNDGNAAALFTAAAAQPDNYTLLPNASGPSPGPDFAAAAASSPGPSAGPGLSLGPGPGVSFSPGPALTPEPTTSGSAGGAVSVGASLFPRPWAPHEPPFWDTPLSHGLNVLVGAALCVTMLGLGCTVDVNRFGAHVRRPVGALLAALCQFGLLPLLAFLLALVFALDEVAAVAVLLCGCCPGGNLSNLMSLLVDGDMNLRYGAASLGRPPGPHRPRPQARARGGAGEGRRGRGPAGTRTNPDWLGREGRGLAPGPPPPEGWAVAAGLRPLGDRELGSLKPGGWSRQESSPGHRR